MGAVIGGAGLVHIGDPHGGAGEGGGHGQGGLTDEGSAVLQEPDGIVGAVGGAEDSVADEHAQSVAGGHVEKVAVDTADHPEAAALQGLGHVGEGVLAQDPVPVVHDGIDAVGRAVGEIALSTQVGPGVAPESLRGEFGAGGQSHGTAM